MVTVAMEKTDAHRLCSGSGHLSRDTIMLQVKLLYLVPAGLPQPLYNFSVVICCRIWPLTKGQRISLLSTWR